MANFILLLMLNFFSLNLLAQWGEDPFVYVPPKSIQTKKTQKSSRSPASLEVKVEEVSLAEQNENKLDKNLAKQIVNNESSPKLEKKSEEIPDQSKEWEKLKNEFKSGKILKHEEPKEVFIKKNHKDIHLGFNISMLNFNSQSEYAPRNYKSTAVFYESKIGIGFSEKLSSHFSYGTSSKMFIDDNPDSSSNTSIDYTNLELGIVYRFLQARDSYIDGTLAGRESTIGVSKSSNYTMGAKTSSLVLGLDYVQKYSKNSRLAIQGRLYPKPNQSEKSDGNWQHQSGSDPEVISAQLGIVYSRNLNSNFKFELSFKHFFEEVQFSESTAVVDPASSTTITNTRVKTEWNSLGFGLAWEY